MASLSIGFPRCTYFSLDIPATPTVKHNTNSIISDLNLFSVLSSETANMSHPPTCHTSCPLCILSQDKKFPPRTQPRGSQGKKGGREVFGAKTRGLEAAWWALRHATPSSPLLTEMQPGIFMRAGRGGTKQTFRALLVQQGLMKSFWNERKFQISEWKKKKMNIFSQNRFGDIKSLIVI